MNAKTFMEIFELHKRNDSFLAFCIASASFERALGDIAFNYREKKNQKFGLFVSMVTN